MKTAETMLQEKTQYDLKPPEPIVKCKHCRREIYPARDRGVVKWIHKYSASQPTDCEAEPDRIVVLD